MENTYKKILIVEDERSLGDILKNKLTSQGLHVKLVYDGKEALDSVQKEEFDLLLIDLVMPNMDGFALIHELKGLKIETPIIVLTNLSQPEDIQKVKALGVLHYLIKANTTMVQIVNYIQQLFQA